jgi:hypothetical protein
MRPSKGDAILRAWLIVALFSLFAGTGDVWAIAALVACALYGLIAVIESLAWAYDLGVLHARSNVVKRVHEATREARR